MLKCFAALTTAIGILYLSGCGPSLDLDNDGGSWSYDYQSPNTAQSTVDSWSVTCQSTSGRGCPTYVAQLLMTDGTLVRACTAELIAPDKMVTNSHCFGEPEQNDNPDQLCKNATVIFPSNSAGGSERAHCAKILVKSDITEKDYRQPDYAVFQLDRSFRRAYAHVSRAGLADGEKVYSARINPNFSGYGTVVAAECTVVHRSFFRPQATSDTDAIEITRGCRSIAGNSGSAVTDAQGNIKALHYAIPSFDGAEKSGNSELVRISYKLASMNPGIVTNAACIAYPFEGAGPIAADCGEFVNEMTMGIPPMNSDEIATQVRADTVAELKDGKLDPRIGGRIVTTDDNPLKQTLSLEPSCFINYNNWLAPLLQGLPEGGAYQIQTEALKWTAALSIDDNMRAQTTTTFNGPISRNVTFYPEKLKATGNSDVFVVSDPTRPNELVGLTGGTWGACVSGDKTQTPITAQNLGSN